MKDNLITSPIVKKTIYEDGSPDHFLAIGASLKIRRSDGSNFKKDKNLVIFKIKDGNLKK